MLKKNLFKEKLSSGQLCVSIMQPFYSTGLTELIGYCNVDAICFDSEHGSLELGQIEDLVRACEVTGITPLARIPVSRPEIILRTMDTGVMGIICPHVKTQEDAKNIVSYVKYPPVGIRGMAMTARAPGYVGMNSIEYVDKSNDETMVIIQIEDYEGVENINSIVKVEGVEAVFIGRNDLSMSMGCKGNTKDAEVQKAIEKVADVTIAAGIPLMLATDEIEGIYWIKKGAKILSIHIVPFLRRKLKEAIKIINSEDI